MSLPIIPGHDGSPQVFYRGTVDREIDLPFNSAVVGDCYIVKETESYYICTSGSTFDQIGRGTPAQYLPPYYPELETYRNIEKLKKLADHFKRCEV